MNWRRASTALASSAVRTSESSASTPAEVRSPNTLRMTSSRSEEHTSELQSLMRISYAVFCLKKKNTKQNKLDLLCRPHMRRACTTIITNTHKYRLNPYLTHKIE